MVREAARADGERLPGGCAAFQLAVARRGKRDIPAGICCAAALLGQRLRVEGNLGSTEISLLHQFATLDRQLLPRHNRTVKRRVFLSIYGKMTTRACLGICTLDQGGRGKRSVICCRERTAVLRQRAAGC